MDGDYDDDDAAVMVRLHGESKRAGINCHNAARHRQDSTCSTAQTLITSQRLTAVLFQLATNQAEIKKRLWRGKTVNNNITVSWNN